MKRTIKLIKGWLLPLMIVLSIGSFPNVFAQDQTVNVSTPEEFVAAINDASKNIIYVDADMDLSGAGVLEVSGRTIDLGGNTIYANNFSLFFEGTDVTIKNGTFHANGGSYALFVGDEGGSDRVVVEDITMVGGINVYNSTDVTLRNVHITGVQYYAVWCDENAHVTIESGYFTSPGAAVLGMSKTETDLIIKGGTFEANNHPLVLSETLASGEPKFGSPIISAGSFDTAEANQYMADGATSMEDENGHIIICDHRQTEIRNEKPASCIEDGYSGDLYCALCHTLLQSGKQILASGHHFDTLWHHDESNHWHECVCKEKRDVAAHTFEWIIDRDASETQTGIKHGECRICAYRTADVEFAFDASGEENEDPDISDKEDGITTDQNHPNDTKNPIKDTPSTANGYQTGIWVISLLLAGAILTAITGKEKKKDQ